LRLEQRSVSGRAPPWLKTWDGNGIISRLSPRQCLELRAGGIPTVDLNDQGPGPCRPEIGSDHRAEGALAAERLLERGFTSFAFFGYPRFAWSGACQSGFTARLQAAGHSCQHYRRAATAVGTRSSPETNGGRARSRPRGAAVRRRAGVPHRQ
jgi:LacI family transcriptional regulator